MCEALRELMKDEIAEAVAVGEAKGMDLLAKLYTKLMAAGRENDWNRAMLDVAYRDMLIKEELGV